jgi:hypothetical protein
MKICRDARQRDDVDSSKRPLAYDDINIRSTETAHIGHNQLNRHKIGHKCHPPSKFTLITTHYSFPIPSPTLFHPKSSP